MNSINITFENPWLLLLLIPALAVILIPFFRIPKSRRKTVKKILPVVLHSVIAFLLVLIISGFSIVEKSRTHAVMILADFSYSTQNLHKNINTHAEELLKIIDEKTPVGVIAFSAEQIYSIKLDENTKTLKTEMLENEATNIADALEYAFEVAPKDKALRIILLSDGLENEGNADAMAYYLSTRGVRIDAMYYDSINSSYPEVQIGSFTGPEGCYIGTEVSLVADIKTNHKTSSKISLYDGDTLIYTKDMELKEGSNVAEIKLIPESAGIGKYKIVVSDVQDTVEKNNSAYFCLDVADRPSVLILSPEKHKARELEAVLKVNNNVTLMTAYDAPNTITELCKYDEIILSNVGYYDLPRSFDQLLDIYVSVYGRSLLAVGGDSTFMYGNMLDTTLESMLPVEFKLNESVEGRTVALMLVLDCSSSMNTERMTVSKQGAINCLQVMSENDYVGIVSFSTEAYLEAPLTAANDNNKETLKRVISGLKNGSGTYYSPALKLAKDELLKSDADIKHIMFLSDGQPVDGGYDQIVMEASEAGITVSTIGLGFYSSNLEYMAMVGKGRYYYVSGADELPDIMLSETEQAKANSYIVGDFTPVVSDFGELTENIGDAKLPNLGGYLGMTLKENGNAYISTETGHPIYSEWQYGQGKVAVFASDFTGEWSRAWFDSDLGKSLISQMVATTVDDIHNYSALVPRYEVDGSRVNVYVTSPNQKSDNTVSIEVLYETSAVPDVIQMTELYPGSYKATFDVIGEGKYEITFKEYDKVKTQIDEVRLSAAISYPEEYDRFKSSGKPLLENICSYSGGTVHESTLSLADIKMPSIRILHDPVIPFAVVCMLLLLTDIAVRKLRWRDIKKYFLRFTAKDQ